MKTPPIIVTQTSVLYGEKDFRKIFKGTDIIEGTHYVFSRQAEEIENLLEAPGPKMYITGSWRGRGFAVKKLVLKMKEKNPALQVIFYSDLAEWMKPNHPYDKTLSKYCFFHEICIFQWVLEFLKEFNMIEP